MGIFIGLTGQTGAGKTTVASRFAERGYYIIDGDVLARDIVAVGSPVLKQLAERFGNDIINQDGTLDRKKLASRAFANSDSTAALNNITHPEIIRRTLDIAENAYKNGYTYVMFDAAALYESGIQEHCDYCISVIAPLEIRLERIIKRDNITHEAAMQRINAQKSEQYYIENSDIIIRNAPPYSLDNEICLATVIIELDDADKRG